MGRLVRIQSVKDHRHKRRKRRSWRQRRHRRLRRNRRIRRTRTSRYLGDNRTFKSRSHLRGVPKGMSMGMSSRCVSKK